jgi:hypothetical protein
MLVVEKIAQAARDEKLTAVCVFAGVRLSCANHFRPAKNMRLPLTTCPVRRDKVQSSRLEISRRKCSSFPCRHSARKIFLTRF